MRQGPRPRPRQTLRAALEEDLIPGRHGDSGRWLTIEKRDEFLASALGAQGKGDGRKAMDGIEAEENVIVLPAKGVSDEHVKRGRRRRRQRRRTWPLAAAITLSSSMSTAMG